MLRGRYPTARSRRRGATGRYFAKFISAIILWIGFMMAGWTARKQALHDIMAGTLVVQKQDFYEPS